MLKDLFLNIFRSSNNYCSSGSETKVVMYLLCEQSFHIKLSHLHYPTDAPLLTSNNHRNLGRAQISFSISFSILAYNPISKSCVEDILHYEC